MSEESKIPAPLLSVCLITYNHVAYIRQAIEGVLMQKTSFDFDLIIADDCSTDGTREILLDYKAKHPTKIRLILQERNVGAIRNWLDLVESPKSKYVAYQEGDDYWVDTDKLERQVSFLEKNDGFVLTFHNTLDWEGDVSRKMYDRLEPEWTISEFIHHTYSRSVSIVYRNLHERLPEAFKKIKLGDSAWFIFMLQFGKARYFEEVMAHYRIHSTGFWSSKNDNEKAILRFELFLGVLEFIQEQHKQLVKNELFELSLTYFLSCCRSNEYKKGLLGLGYFLRSPLEFKISKATRVLRNRIRLK